MRFCINTTQSVACPCEGWIVYRHRGCAEYEPIVAKVLTGADVGQNFQVWVHCAAMSK